MDYCPIIQPYGNRICEYGVVPSPNYYGQALGAADNACFTSSLILDEYVYSGETAACYRFSCAGTQV